MNKKISYRIDEILESVMVPSDQQYFIGENILLSDKENDISYNQSWYQKGHCCKTF